MGHKAAILILFFVLLQTPRTFGETSDIALFSYSELMQLSPEQRTQYIADVQSMLVELSKSSTGHFSDSDPKARTRLKAWLEMMEINLAEAQEVAPAASRPVGSTIPASTNAVWKPGRELPSSTIEQFVRSRASRGLLSCRSKFQTENFPGAREVPECTPEGEARIQAAFEAQQTVVAKAMAVAPAGETGSVQPSASAAGEAVAFPVATANVVTTAVAATAANTTGKQVGRKIPYSEIEAQLKAGKNPHSLCAEDEKSAGTGPMALVKTDGDTSYCMTDQAAALFREGKLDLATGTARSASAASAASSTKRAPAESPSVASQYSCAPKPKACPDPKASKTQVYAGNQSCIFAGMISKLDSQNKRCDSVTEFKLPDVTFKCGKEQTMCNPMLFGATSTNSPICIGRGQDATAQCSKLSTARDAEKFINRNVGGLQEKWDEFKKNLSDICKPDSPSAKFHCSECNIMEARIFEINARILGKNTCGSRSQGMDAVGSRILHKSVPVQQNRVKK